MAEILVKDVIRLILQRSDQRDGVWRTTAWYKKTPGVLSTMLTILDIIREWQAKHLYDEYKLTNLHVFRSKISKSFNHQVLATLVFSYKFPHLKAAEIDIRPDFDDKKNLLVIMHDP